MSAGIVTSLTRPWTLNCISRRQRIDDIWQYIPSGSKKDVNMYICHPCMQSLCRALRKILITSVVFSRAMYLLERVSLITRTISHSLNYLRFIVQTEWTYLQKINDEYCSTKSEIIILLKQTKKKKSIQSSVSSIHSLHCFALVSSLPDTQLMHYRCEQPLPACLVTDWLPLTVTNLSDVESAPSMLLWSREFSVCQVFLLLSVYF